VKSVMIDLVRRCNLVHILSRYDFLAITGG
jgi:hypothetical protein